MTAPTEVKRWAGFRVVDLGPWRSVTCTACENSVGVQAGDDVMTELAIDGHRCGPVGTPWGEAGPPGPGPAHAHLLRSVRYEVLTAGVRLYARDQEVIDAGLELLDALSSQLHQGFDTATGQRPQLVAADRAPGGDGGEAA